ncbi:hypothetical protein PFISCL1PPCAC_27703, partial [Pristionchus fissidentatus]
VQWAKKWSNKDVDTLEKLNYDELHNRLIKLADDVSSVFGHLYFASARVAHLSKAKTLVDINEVTEVINKLSQQEQDLFKFVAELTTPRGADDRFFLTNVVTSMFERLYLASARVAHLTKAETITVEDIDEAIAALNFSRPESDLFEGVVERSGTEFVTKVK